MASKNIKIMVGTALVIVAFIIGTYLSKLFNNSSQEVNMKVEISSIGPEYDASYNRNMIPFVQKPLKLKTEIKKLYAREFVFTDLDSGKEVLLSDFKGKFLVLNLWRSGCVVCVHELRGLMQAQKDYAGKPVEFIALALDSRRLSEIYAFLKKNNLEVKPLYADMRNTVKTQRKSNSIPETLFIGPSGKILASIKQPINWNTKDSRTLLHRYMKKVSMSK